MSRVQTEQFGELEYSDEAAIEFPCGMPGFEQCRRFVLLNQPELEPLVHLQSLEIANLCFLALPVRAIDPNYETVLSTDDRAVLGLVPGRNPNAATLDLALLSVAADGRVTANLLAPVVIHLAARRAVQAVRTDSKYSHQHALQEALEETNQC